MRHFSDSLTSSAGPESGPGVAPLEIRNVSRRFGDQQAVDQVSFEVAAGEFFSLVGTSGCGKTSLLRMISGLDTPDSGDILLDGKSLLPFPPEARPLHTVFQNYALFPHMSVADNVAFPLRMRRRPPHDIARRVAEVLEHVALSDKAGAMPNQLSGGQRQRVALARAIADLPRILLLDEPLAALDAKLREQMQAELIQLQRTLGITFIFVTHAQTEALALSHRIAVMNGGRIEQIDTPERIYRAPRNKFVADFIGHCTLLPATVAHSTGNALLLDVPPLGRIVAPPAAAAPGRQGWLLLRPEQVCIGPPGSFDTLPNRVPGAVSSVIYAGDVTSYSAGVAGGLQLEAMQANTAPGPVSRFQHGQPVTLAWPATVGTFLQE